MPNGSLSLAEYPAAMVRLKCWKCDRSGQYRKAALIEKYGLKGSRAKFSKTLAPR